MDVARLNFSHGEHADHEENYIRVRAASDATGKAVGVLADLQGPKIRLGRFKDERTTWANGEEVRITVDDVEGTHDRVGTTYKELARDAKAGDRLLVDDGKVGLVVTSIDGNDVVCRVTEGGPVSNNKGALSLPGMNVSVPALSGKDIADLEFALKLGVDFIALSFVRSPADVELVHAIMDRVGRRVPVIAKLEKPEAIDNLEAIVLAFDAVMVARGDLGVELPLEQVPLVQKRAIQIARENAKPVIVATQMLESMIENSRPTRAEASDVANAVLDGADRSHALGRDFGGQVRHGNRSHHGPHRRGRRERINPCPTVDPTSRAPSAVSSRTQHATSANVSTPRPWLRSLSPVDTVRRLARLHTPLPLLAFTPLPAVRSQLTLTWGTETFLVDAVATTDEMVRQVDSALLSLGRYVKGDLVVIVAGSPPGTVGSTNLIHVHRIGEEDH